MGTQAGIRGTDRTLPANRMIFEIRRDLTLTQRFQQNIEPVMEEYGLSDVEREAFRQEDISALAELGLHPYFLPQVARLFHGSAYNHNDSEAARVYAKHMIDGNKEASNG